MAQCLGETWPEPSRSAPHQGDTVGGVGFVFDVDPAGLAILRENSSEKHSHTLVTYSKPFYRIPGYC